MRDLFRWSDAVLLRTRAWSDHYSVIGNNLKFISPFLRLVPSCHNRAKRTARHQHPLLGICRLSCCCRSLWAAQVGSALCLVWTKNRSTTQPTLTCSDQALLVTGTLPLQSWQKAQNAQNGATSSCCLLQSPRVPNGITLFFQTKTTPSRGVIASAIAASVVSHRLWRLAALLRSTHIFVSRISLTSPSAPPSKGAQQWEKG